MASDRNPLLTPALARAWGDARPLFKSEAALRRALIEQGVPLGYDARGRMRYAPVPKLLAGALVTGASRLGKTVFAYLIAAFFMAIGVSVVLMDFKGDFARSILPLAMRLGRRPEDVVIVDPHSDNVVGINPLGIVGKATHESTAMHVLEMLRRLQREESPGIWMAEYGVPALALVGAANHSLLEVLDFADPIDPRYRDAVVATAGPRMIDPMFVRKFQELSGLRPEDIFNRTSPLRSRISLLRQSRLMRRVFGSVKGCLDWKTVLDRPGSVTVVDLGLGAEVSEAEAKALGSTILQQISMVGWSRRGDEKSKRNRCIVIIDEAERVLNRTVADGYEKLAGLGVSFLSIVQDLAQLAKDDEYVARAVLGNSSFKASFGVDIDDAAVLAKNMYAGWLPTDKVKLVLEQTKFRPNLELRETTSESDTDTSTWSRGEGKGESEAHGESAQRRGFDYSPSSRGDSSNRGVSKNTTDTMGGSSGKTKGRTWGWVNNPQPFREPSSVQYFSVAELLDEATGRMAAQSEGHVTAWWRGHPPVELRVPPIRELRARDEDVADFVHDVEAHSARPVAEVEREIAMRVPTFLASQSPSRRKASASPPGATGQPRRSASTPPGEQLDLSDYTQPLGGTDDNA